MHDAGGACKSSVSWADGTEQAMQIVQEINNSIPSPMERKDVVKATLDSVKKAKGKATYLLPLLTFWEEVCKADASVQCDLSVKTGQKEIEDLRQMVRGRSGKEPGGEEWRLYGRVL